MQYEKKGMSYQKNNTDFNLGTVNKRLFQHY